MPSAAQSKPPLLTRDDGLWLLGLCLARSGFSMIHMTYAATMPLLQIEWAMSAGRAGTIHSAFNIGYLISLFSVGFLADRYGAKRVFLVFSVAAAVSAFSFALFAQDFPSGFALYFATALFAGGSYTPVLTLMAQRFQSQQRGRAIGYYIAASSLGAALSLFLSGVMMEVGGWRAAFYVTAIGPVLGCLLALWTTRHTPNVVPEHSPDSGEANLWREVITNRPALLVMLAYTCHSWESLGARAWLPAFLAAGLMTTMGNSDSAAGLAATLTAIMLIISMGGNIVGGNLSDRWGRTAVMLLMGVGSLICSFTLGWLVAMPLWLLVAVGVVYSFSAIGDSSSYSAALTEVVHPRYLGAAYSLRSVCGFGAGAISPAVLGVVLDWSQGGSTGTSALAWGLAFGSLGLAALPGPVAILWLRRLPESARMAGGLR